MTQAERDEPSGAFCPKVGARQRLRILRIVARLPPIPGGMEVHAAELTSAQARAGDAVDLLFRTGLPSAGVSAAHRVPELRPPLSWLPAQPLFGWQAARPHTDLGPEYDVVHAHGDYAAAWAARRQADRFACPALLTVHGSLSDSPVHRLLARAVFTRLDGVIAVSEAIRAQLRARRVPDHRIRVLPSGIRSIPASSPEGRGAARAQLGIAGGVPLFAAVGRLHRVKGYDLLIAAMPDVWRRRPEAVLAIAGDGPEARTLQRLAAEDPRIRLLGEVPFSEIVRLLRAADCFVHPARELPRQREGSPTAVLEALAAGLPVIAARTGGLPELVRDGVNGILVPPESPGSLAAAMLRRLEGDGHWNDLRSRSRAHPLLRTWPEVAELVSALMRELIAAGPGGGRR